MRHFFLYTILFTVFVSCKKDYIIGGSPNPSNKVNMTTYDFLKSYDVTKKTARLIERAGLINEVNKNNITIVAPSDYAVNRYLLRANNRRLRLDPKATLLTVETIDPAELGQLKMYIVDGKFLSKDLITNGIKLASHYAGDSLMLYLDQTNAESSAAWDGGFDPGAGYQYSNFMQTIPIKVYVHFKRGSIWEMLPHPADIFSGGYDNPECDAVYTMYISDVETTNGVVHVIYEDDHTYTDHYYYHSLFFFGTRADDLL